MKKLKAIRIQKGLTLQKLSVKSSVAIGYIADLENGKASNPSLNTLRKLATALEIELTDLLDTA
ncbi:helix-turn-helix transcriptional regulator [Crassaminicella thermophila]|uniref:Helix-turn-helix transcriptional regulator n=1 Tax=Crassaminicella thermophila TaxID=2599308 RepID=A0A5C0SFV4_CRATE|nr:helix-turn-helix transcriptional regulator [Crassaminicella thermophila]QEK12626.1 helix-turn-helix transcriptional regulator [Crassaminicella thermophila]